MNIQAPCYLDKNNLLKTLELVITVYWINKRRFVRSNWNDVIFITTSICGKRKIPVAQNSMFLVNKTVVFGIQKRQSQDMKTFLSPKTMFWLRLMKQPQLGFTKYLRVACSYTEFRWRAAAARGAYCTKHLDDAKIMYLYLFATWIVLY